MAFWVPRVGKDGRQKYWFSVAYIVTTLNLGGIGLDWIQSDCSISKTDVTLLVLS